MAIRNFEGQEPQIANSCYIDPMALIIGDVRLAEDVSIWPMCVLRGDINKITIGKGTNVQDGAIIHVNHKGEFNPEGDPVVIGEHVTIGHQAVIHGCSIDDYSLIGIGAKILDRAHIQSEVMVAAGSVVAPNKILESGFLYMGAPAKKARPLTGEEKAYLRYSANHYVKLQRKHKENGE